MTQRNPSLTTIEIRKDIAHLAHTYCVFNDLKMKDFVSEILENHLKEFNEKLEEIGKVGGEK